MFDAIRFAGHSVIAAKDKLFVYCVVQGPPAMVRFEIHHSDGGVCERQRRGPRALNAERCGPRALNAGRCGGCTADAGWRGGCTADAGWGFGAVKRNQVTSLA